ncbi:MULTISPECIES: hypothetical protein [unclassified Streptomyces]|uniref:hypothetical protein n=1 Tax=unclassified Streptomyces TaxID=2593676 RepID=UPI0016607AAD|nr:MULTISPECIES: hypothetical protein [unclassified Streptomyces]MBD0710435.1 hypothetical protein [Streptomyces sp. CBMA291]MBD0712770.1 hypothetical protein [Streptomyces sp. CBMA370]
MGAAVLALGTGAVTASGCVWYVPALVDLRAGADRPVSRRLAAASCVTGWATAAVVVPLLLLGVPFRPLLAVAAVGAGGAIALRVRAVARRRHEEREAAVCWATLGPQPTPPSGARPQTVLALWAGAGLLVAVATATLLLTWGRTHGVSTPLAVAAPTALAACALLAAALRAAQSRETWTHHP